MFSAILIDKTASGQTAQRVSLDEARLPTGDVTVAIDYSTLNYKDALAITGRAPVARRFPMVPGIDLAGRVTASDNPDFSIGQPVVLNGSGIGETHWGGLAQQARVSGDWLIPLPTMLSTRQAMAIGTAGYTAALCVRTLIDHGVTPEQGEVLVTGATGGVGSIAIALARMVGFTVVAATGKTSEEAYLKRLGAAMIVDRAELSAPGSPIQTERWAGVIDSVGSHTLANACAATRYGGAITACGLAQGSDLPATVLPFILRGVTLYGIDSVMASKPKRLAAWDMMARDLLPETLDAITTEITLDDAIDAADRLLAGTVRGRLVVDVNR